MTETITETDLCVVKTELYDPNVMEQLLRDTASFSRKDLTRLSLYHKHRVHGNRVKVVYEYGRGCEKNHLGRLYVKDGQGLQSFPFDMRNPLLEKHYWDIDMENAHYYLLQKLADDWGLKTDAISHYIRNRDEELKKVSSDRRIAKTTFLKIAYGGNIKLYNEHYNDEGVSVDADLTLVRRIEKEMKVIVDMCWNKHPQYQSVVKKKTNPQFSLFALILQTEERKCLRLIDSFLSQKGRNVGILIHDGCGVEKKDSETAFPEDLLRGAEAYVMENLGYEVKLVNKPYRHNYSPASVPAYVVVPPNVNVNDAFAASEFAKLMGNKIVLDCGKVWVFDDTTGIWSCEDAFLKRLVTRMGSALVFSQGEKTFDYSGSVKSTANLCIKLPDVLPVQDGYFKSRLHSSMNKLLFVDGIYDLKTNTFTKGFDPEVVFHASIPRPFPVVRNKEAEEFVLNTLFREPFLRADIGDVLLHYLCRGLFGDFLMKILLVCIGKGNSSKGTLCSFLTAVFGKVVGSFTGNSLLHRNGDAEATKSLSFVKSFYRDRVAFSNEISVVGEKPKPIDANILKNLVSGGDEITIRTNYKDEEKIVNQCLPALFVNDLPPIAPPDNPFRNRLVAIPYHYAFMETPVLPTDKKADKDIKLKLMKQENLDAFIHIAIDTMRNWNGEQIELPKECCALRDDIAPSQTADLIDILEEEFEITKNDDDYVVTADLLTYLRNRGKEGSDKFLGNLLTDIGLKVDQKKIDRRNTKIRRGIRLLQDEGGNG